MKRDGRSRSEPEQGGGRGSSARRQRTAPDVRTHVGYLLMTLAQTLRAATAAAMAADGLNPRQFGLLRAICADGPISQSQLGQRMRIDRTTMVAFVDRLEALGFAERRRDEDDRRNHAVAATEAGRRVAERLEQVAQEVQATFLAPLSRAEQKTFTALLQKLMAGNDESARRHLAED